MRRTAATLRLACQEALPRRIQRHSVTALHGRDASGCGVCVANSAAICVCCGPFGLVSPQAAPTEPLDVHGAQLGHQGLHPLCLRHAHLRRRAGIGQHAWQSRLVATLSGAPSMSRVCCILQDFRASRALLMQQGDWRSLGYPG